MRHLLVPLAAAVALAACPGAAGATVPRGFVGVMADGPLAQPQAPLQSEARVMGRSGVQSMRTVFAWTQVQPFARMSDVPAAQRRSFVLRHGVPTDFSATDRVVRVAARAGLDVLPVVQVAPDWAARHPGPFSDPGRYASPPSRPTDYARFLRTLIERYGPRGDFWRTLPKKQRRPIRRWQVWNEPMLAIYWSDQPFLTDYVALLRAAHRAAHIADRGAQVITAGLPNLGGGRGSWNWLKQLYAAGARGAFDAVAIHPYANNAANVLRTAVRVRRVMRRHGDRRLPILLTEVGWSRRRSLRPPPAAFGSFDATRADQVSRLRGSYRLLAAARRSLGIEGVYWATWLSVEKDPADWTQWTGLRVVRGTRVQSTPALAAFREVARALERAPNRRRAGATT